MPIKDSLEADAFFMEKVWDRHDRESIQTLSMELLDTYIQCLSSHLKLSFKDTNHLAREMGYHAISVFLDTTYRLRQKISRESQNNPTDFKDHLSQFFSEETVQTSMSASRILRCNLANMVLQSLGEQPIFADIKQEPEQIRLEDLELPLAKEELYWQLHYNLTERIPNGLKQYAKAYLNQLRQYFRKDIIRIGYINLDCKYMLQLPDIQFVPLELTLEEYLRPAPIDARRKLYEILKSSFIFEIGKIEDWELCLGETKVNEEFLELLLAFIILKSESLLCQTERLNQAIDYCEKALEAKKMKALFGSGWYRFQNAVIAIAGRSLNLPIIEFQHGGAPIYQIGKGFDWGTEYHDKNLNVDFILNWGDLKCNQKENNTIYKKIANPLFHSIKKHVKKTINNDRTVKILYTPISLSHLYSVENWLSTSSYDMLEHRKWAEKIFHYLDDEMSSECKIYVKTKNFGGTLYKNYEWMFFPEIKTKKIKVEYLSKGMSFEKMDYVDLHMFCGPSTTFAESMLKNIPSICIWDENIFSVKKHYVSLFEKLLQVGVICKDKKCVKSSIEKYFFQNKWFDEKTQKVREEFCNNFAFEIPAWEQFNNNVLVNLVSQSSR
jgi:hypothetical protein